MKVKYLIIELQKHDQDAEVVVDGLDVGLTDVRKVETITAYKNVDRPFWCGRYGTIPGIEYTPKDAQPVSVVYLLRLDDEDADEDWRKK